MVARTICALALFLIPLGGAQARRCGTSTSAADALRGTLTERDNLLVYYAGHGVLDKEADEGFWLSADAEEDNSADWISVATITRTVRAMSAKHVMVVSDSCYSGRLTREAAASLKSGSEREDELRRLSAKRSRTALVSGGLEPVLDGGGEGHSVFTRAFLTALQETDEVMDGQQLFAAVRRPVIVKADQTPEYSDIVRANHEGGDFLFVPTSLLTAADEGDGEESEVADLQQGTTRGITVTGSGRESADARTQRELAFWDTVKDSGNADMLRAYIAQFPDGTYADLAMIMIAQIEGAEVVVLPDDDDPPPKTFEVEATDITLVATENANVRAQPATSSERLTTIPAGAEVAVTGKVVGEDWYQVARADGGEGYVYGPLLDVIEEGVWMRTAAQRAVVSRWQDAIEQRLGQ